MSNTLVRYPKTPPVPTRATVQTGRCVRRERRRPQRHHRQLRSVTGRRRGRTTSQQALPQDACDLVYATEGYEQSITNLAQTSLDSHQVFSDGYSLQLAKVSGSVADGFTAALAVAV